MTDRITQHSAVSSLIGQKITSICIESWRVSLNFSVGKIDIQSPFEIGDNDDFNAIEFPASNAQDSFALIPPLLVESLVRVDVSEYSVLLQFERSAIRCTLTQPGEAVTVSLEDSIDSIVLL